MLQIKNNSGTPFKIKSIRKIDKAEQLSTGAACSLEPDNGSDKPPC